MLVVCQRSVGDGADPVDDVGVPAAEGGGAGRPAAGEGVDAGVGRPRPLGRQVVRGQMVRVAVVELGVGRDAEAAAGRGAPAQVGHDPAAGRDRRAPGGAEAVVAIDPDAGLDDQPRADRLPQLDDAAGARERALAERGRVDGVPAGRGAERQLRRRAERGAPAAVGRHGMRPVAVVGEGRPAPVVDEAVAVRAVGAVDRQQRARRAARSGARRSPASDRSIRARATGRRTRRRRTPCPGRPPTASCRWPTVPW